MNWWSLQRRPVDRQRSMQIARWVCTISALGVLAAYAALIAPRALQALSERDPMVRGLLLKFVGVAFLFVLPHQVVAAILWWPVWRAHRRRRTGLCPACGYDRRGLSPSAVCPECGAAPN